MKTINPYLQGKLPKPPIPIKQRTINNIDVEVFFQSHFSGEFTFTSNLLCPFPGHEDSKPSFRAKEDGSYKCFGCEKGGSNVIQFQADITASTYKNALTTLYLKHVATSHETIEKRVKTLKKAFTKEYNKETLSFLQITRGWHRDIIDYFELGLYENAKGIRYVSIPIKDEYGYYKTIIYYNFTGEEDTPKFFYDTEGDNTPTIFPYEVLHSSKKILFLEGQPDCLLALSLKYPAVTFGSANAWKDSWKHYIKELDATVCYDNDEPGRRGGNYLCSQLILHAATVKQIQVPTGNDFTDFLSAHNFDRKQLDDIIDDTTYQKLQEIPDITYAPQDHKEAKLTNLNNASMAENYGTRLRLVALVGGKEPSPLLIPRRLMLACRDTPARAKCATCALSTQSSLTRIFEVDEYFKDLLGWVVTAAKDQSKIYRKSLGVNVRCKVDITYHKMWNVEKVILNSPVRHGKLEDLPERRIGFFLGAGLIPNKHYTLDLYTLQHPLDNTAVHVITHAEPLDTELENFEMTPEIALSLQSFAAGDDIDGKLHQIYEIISKNVTRIWGRYNTHIAIDLPFFSPNEFIFNKELIKKASLDVLIFGDQRCGKGRIAEGLVDYYRFAEVLSGENISFMNLVGGIETSDSYRGLKWGRIVANNRGVVVIDEASALETKTISRLSRIRSEGVAELDKFGIHAKAMARCSLIWIANTRNDPLSKFNFGVEALRELIGQNEDISRFDYVIAVRANEVESKLINRFVPAVEDIYGNNLHRALILWCKTRTKEQIIFDKAAVTAIFHASEELGKIYTSVIPLVQIENIRIKLAKIAAAVAGRTFSTDSLGRNLIVQKRHVTFSKIFLRDIYNGQALGYHDFSKMEMMMTKISYKELDHILDPLKDIRVYNTFINGLLQRKELNASDIADLSGQSFYDSKILLSSLTRIGAIQKGKGGYYVKTNSFIDYLRERFHGVVKE